MITNHPLLRIGIILILYLGQGCDKDRRLLSDKEVAWVMDWFEINPRKKFCTTKKISFAPHEGDPLKGIKKGNYEYKIVTHEHCAASVVGATVAIEKELLGVEVSSSVKGPGEGWSEMRLLHLEVEQFRDNAEEFAN